MPAQQQAPRQDSPELAQRMPAARGQKSSNPISIARGIYPISSRLQALRKHGSGRHSDAASSQSSTASSLPRFGTKALASDSFAGFLQQHGVAGQWPLGHSQNALWPDATSQPAQASTDSGADQQCEVASSLPVAHSPLSQCQLSSPPRQPVPISCDLTVGATLVEHTLTPGSAGQHVPSSSQTQHTGAAMPGQLPTPLSTSTLPLMTTDMPCSSAASSSLQADGAPMQAASAQSMEPGSSTASGPGSAVGCAPSSLTGGAVLLQNPDGSLQYVVLTSEDEVAVQLSLRAKQAKHAQQEAAGEAPQVS